MMPCFFLFVYVLTDACSGNLVKVVIPRPDPSGAPVAGVGRVSAPLALLPI